MMFGLVQATRGGRESSVKCRTAIMYLGDFPRENMHGGFHVVLRGACA